MRQHLTAGEWELLKREDHVTGLRQAHASGDDVGQFEEVLTFAVRLIKNVRATVHGGPVQDSTDPEQTLDVPETPQTIRLRMGRQSAAYARALSANVTARAKHDRQAVAFRSDHLSSGLLTTDQVEGWVDDQVRAQPPERRWARVPVPAGWSHGQPLPYVNASTSVELLQYVVPGLAHVIQEPVAPGGVLARLWRLAKGLATAYGWEPAQAVTWTLTGVTPLLGLLRITEGGEVIRDFELMTWAERIVLTVHPAVKPEEVQRAFSDARDDLVQRRSGSIRRSRAQSIPHLILARYVAGQVGGDTWDERRRAWNRWVDEHQSEDEFKDVRLKRYQDAAQFKRDATVACQRVLHFGSYIGPGSGTAAATNFAADQEREGVGEEEMMLLTAASRQTNDEMPSGSAAENPAD